MLDLHPELAVDRDEVLGLGQPEHQLELLLAGVPGDVGTLDRVVEDVGAGLEQVVDRARDVLLVAGDRAGADDHRVARLDLDEPVVAVRHPGQAGHRLALGAGRRDHELAVRVVLDLVLGHHPRRVVLEVAQVRGDAEVLLHRAADHGHAPVHLRRRVEDLLDPGDVAGEGRDDHPALERLHDLAEGIADRPLRRGVAGVLGPRRVGQQAGHAFLAEAGQDREVRQLPVDRGVVELEVARVDDGADRRSKRDAHRVRDRVTDPEGHDLERADVDLVARLERDQRIVVELVLLDLVAEQAAGQRRGVDRHAGELGQHVRQCADVVLVGMGDQERLDVGASFLEVGDVGDDQVDPEHLLVREHQAAVDHHDLVAVLEDEHVLADLPHPAERDDSERLVVRGWHLGPWHVG